MTDLYTRLNAVDLDAIEPISMKRYETEMPREAKKALNRLIGTGHGISIRRGRGTAWGYIDVILPKVHPQEDCTAGWQPNGDFVPMFNCEGCRAESAAEHRIEEILYRLYPSTDDRSDSQTDYFDFVWSVDTY